MTDTAQNGHGGLTKLTANDIADALEKLKLANAQRMQQNSYPYWPGMESRLFGTSGERRSGFNLFKECNYRATPTLQDYNWLYCRGGIATRVVDIWPDECWSAYPDLYETDDKRITKFERAKDAVWKKTSPWSYIHRADRLSGVYQYAILFYGFDDGRPLDQPPPNIDPRTGEPLTQGEQAPVNLMFLRAFSQDMVEISKVDSDVYSPRYGFPTEYNISFTIELGTTEPNRSVQQTKVHWTRVLHLADNCKTSEVLGTPRLEPVLNLIDDIHKVQGGSAEMFIKAGFPVLSFETYPDIAGEAAIDFDAVKAEVQKYEMGFQRFFANVGGKWVALAPPVANPAAHMEQFINLLCATIGVPTRILMGTEAAHLASTQDAGAWKDRLRGRQSNYLEPRVVRPFVDRLIAVGVLPQVKNYIITWRDLRALSDKDRAEVALKQVQSLMMYISGGVEGLYEYKMFLTTIMGLSEDQADAIVKVRKTKEIVVPPGTVDPTADPMGGGRIGKPNKADVGKPPGTKPEGT